MNFTTIFVFATITPLIVIVILADSYIIGKKINSSSESAMREVWCKHQVTVLFVAFVAYSPASYKIFHTFGCDDLDDGAYLRADYSIFCLTPRHSWYKVYALIMMGVHPVAIPAAVTGLMISRRCDFVRSDRETMLQLKPLNSLWAAYMPYR